VINLGNPNNTLDDLLGPLTLNGQGPTNVNGNDQGSSTAHSYTLTAGALARDGIALITFGGALGGLGVNAGSGDDTFTVVSEPAVFPVVFDGGPGTNTLLARDAVNLWDISAQGAGLVNTVFFRSVQNLTGGADTATFALRDGTGVSGSIDGGGGRNTLDFSAYTSNVIVDLPLGLATGVGGTIANIQNLTGGAGSNILVGDGGNVLTGGTGRSLLIAGATASTLVGGGADSILVGGTTAYDLDLASLQFIMDYWAQSDDYNTRVANLTSGNVVPLLDGTTVTGNGGGNLLQGGPGLDLFYGNMALDTIVNWDPAMETFVSV